MSRSVCPLCGDGVTRVALSAGEARQYYRCATCSLIHVPATQHLSAAAERARYELHNNDAEAGYVSFLRRLADPVIERLRPGARGLDFGSGPAPVLAGVLASAGFPCEAYDPFFAPDESLLAAEYDFVTCTEVVEHAHDPAATFSTLRRLVRPGGILGVMTRFHPDETAFGDWWYRRDPTHVCFYDERTMRWIGNRYGMDVEFPRPDVSLFTPA